VAGLGRRTVIDEVQRTPELLLAIKSRVDRNDAPGQFLLTGSANRAASRRSQTRCPAEPTTSRCGHSPRARPTGDRRASSPGCSAARSQPIGDAPVGRSEYAEMLLAGGFPEARARGAASRRRFFDSYVTSIVERDAGLLAALIGADARRVREDDGFAGALFETFVATELER
jgi:predicted AAA+ superfamily ATPase